MGRTSQTTPSVNEKVSHPGQRHAPPTGERLTQRHVALKPHSRATQSGPAPTTSRVELPTAPEHVTRRTSDNTSGQPDLDVLTRIPNMYRLLELHSEPGSGGLVEKIVICQESIRLLLDKESPGAYTSVSKIDFIALDKLEIKPHGVYGSKSEIIRFLESLNAVDLTTAQLLRDSRTEISVQSANGPVLRSGLYLLRQEGELGGASYVIYWPEDTTWEPSPASSVARNRVTFMRYLTRLADQILALISEHDERSLIWHETETTSDDNQSNSVSETGITITENHASEDEEEYDRLFTFQVSQTNEQSESVAFKPGFEVPLPRKMVEQQDQALPSEFGAIPLQTILVHGDRRQGYLCARFREGTTESIPFQEEWPILRLQSNMGNTSRVLRLSEPLSQEPEMLELLMENGLRDRFPSACSAWDERRKDITSHFAEQRLEVEKTEQSFTVDTSRIRMTVRRWMFEEVKNFYPHIYPEGILSNEDSPEESMDPLEFNPDISRIMQEALRSSFLKLSSPSSQKHTSEYQYRKIKLRCLTVHRVLSSSSFSSDMASRIIKLILLTEEEGSFHQELEKYLHPDEGSTSAWKSLMPRFGTSSTSASSRSHARDFISRALVEVDNLPDPEFLRKLRTPVSQNTSTEEVVVFLDSIVHAIIQNRFGHVTEALTRRIATSTRKHSIATELQKLRDAEHLALKESCQTFATEIEIHITTHPTSGTTLEHIQWKSERSYWAVNLQRRACQVRGRRVEVVPAKIIYEFYTLSLTQSDAHELDLDPEFIPNPQPTSPVPFTFELPVTRRIRHMQLVGSRHALLICDDQGVTHIYLNEQSRLTSSPPNKSLHHDRLGRNILFSFEETHRLLAIFFIRDEKPFLHVMVVDPHYTSITSRGSHIDLTEWYPYAPRMRHISFVAGTQEVLFAEEEGNCRIFSLITEQIRPASLTLTTRPTAILPAPDGSCLIVIEPHIDGPLIRVFHYASFGMNPEGIASPLLASFQTSNLVATTFGQSGYFHILSLDAEEGVCRSLAIHITQKTSEFLFQGTDGRRHVSNRSLYNPWISCHADVWTRFPVVPTISRENLSPHHRRPPSVSFVCQGHHSDFEANFREMIRSFEKTTKKPTGGSLSAIHIQALSFEAFINGGRACTTLSSFRLGAWIVELFCLIPIQIAIVSSNRFVPMKDGRLNPDFERSLLGADVNRLVDEMSIGWYESIFSSYMARKPVKVVSSMGEQSVGKSFALNHFVDTTFAGSAMRCTEGVWLSVTPTADALIVALDFEGVHSIERSAQEDMLLVLFNAALSNLILFRNNFALSRDIAGLFTSFQSSSTVLDPAQNPTLFQSTLAIIIKDVVDSDAREIVKEFTLKFQKIVQNEQANNFLTRLHRGKLNIIPWPVIESPQFYDLFKALRTCLKKQKTTHSTAGSFLHSLKVLMAKLKANDWGALENNLAAHRAQQLSDSLNLAIQCGLAEVDPYPQPLKNIDTGEDIAEEQTTNFQLFLPSNRATAEINAQTREIALSRLRQGWPQGKELRQKLPDEEWTERLSRYITALAQSRLQHVKAWLDQNTARFPGSNPDIRALMQAFEEASAEALAGIQLCGMSCVECRLVCINAKQHLGDHDCKTDHKCGHMCDFSNSAEHPGAQDCGFPAGHSGRHLCQTASHFCGQPCTKQDRDGCLGVCAKDVDHEENEHSCSARTHACGLPCHLSTVLGSDGSAICSGKCKVDCEVPHNVHVCEKTSCPVRCQLCRRLCASPDHSHPLEQNAIHLCGQDHACPQQCESAGVCDIATTPHSIESTFRGKHETFQYTKYTQEARRLPCGIRIPPEQLAHEGPHIHRRDPKVFHYCETRCRNCSYYCTLPLGHPQQEHETSHGSMSETQWAIDGADNTSLEVQGRKFATGDAGGPMLCSLVCGELGRHVHVDFCRGNCGNADIQHIQTLMNPSPERGKDWISHQLYWARTGFKDPYSRDDQTEFAKCDAMCSDPEHAATATTAANPSFCTLPMFHPPYAGPAGSGYISIDGHHFTCQNPALSINAFHVIFVIDRSGSMSLNDRLPLANAPASALIARYNNNRFGAVLSSLYSFWRSRHQATAARGAQGGRRDAYSVILFDHSTEIVVSNDFVSNPDQLLNPLLNKQCDDGGTNFGSALQLAQSVMQNNWSTERNPVIIFLSDGECRLADNIVYDLCRLSIRLGKALSLHAVSFGNDAESYYLRRMSQIATEICDGAPRDIASGAESSYTDAIDTIRLSQTFLNIANSMRNARGGLMRI